MRKFASTYRTHLLLLALTLLPIAKSLKSIIIGSIPFWHDPARDLLHAWENLSKPTLIGPPTGIEGIFYGPYWIWWISFWQIFTKNPRFVILMSETIPLLLVFPAIWLLFRKFIKSSVLISLWLLFILAFINYTNFLWNPHLSLIFLLALIFRLASCNFSNKNLVIIGVLVGLVGNFHMSIGLITAVTTFLYLGFWELIRLKTSKKINLKHTLVAFTMFGLGLCLTIVPFSIFELRHDFLQTRTFISNFQETVINERETGLGGITGIEIGQRFVGRASTLLHTNEQVAKIVFILSLLVLFYSLHQKKLLVEQKKPLSFCLIFTLTLMTIYVKTNNPVWDYHFIGTEVVIMCFLALAATHNRFLKYSLILWASYIFMSQLFSFANSFEEDALKLPGLENKRSIAEIIIKDADRTFQWEAYSNDWRTTDFEYMFKWLGQNEPNYDQGKEQDVDLKYLIIPVTSQDLHDDFIYYKSADEIFETTNVWTRPDGTEIIKREKKD